MGTGCDGHCDREASCGPSPTPTAAWTTSPADGIANAIGIDGDVAHSAPRSDDEYTDPNKQPSETEVSMET
jgi:hypothetical protein